MRMTWAIIPLSPLMKREALKNLVSIINFEFDGKSQVSKLEAIAKEFSQWIYDPG